MFYNSSVSVSKYKLFIFQGISMKKFIAQVPTPKKRFLSLNEIFKMAKRPETRVSRIFQKKFHHQNDNN
jgi:hypothetical protein